MHHIASSAAAFVSGSEFLDTLYQDAGMVSAGDVVGLLPTGDKTNALLAFLFLIIGVIAAILGFGGIYGTAIGIAKVIFFIFIALLSCS